MSRLALVALVAFNLACGKGTPGTSASPKSGALCPEGESGYVEVNNSGGTANIYATVGGSGLFMGIARSGRTTLRLPKGSRRAYVGGATADEGQRQRQWTQSAVVFEYRCE